MRPKAETSLSRQAVTDLILEVFRLNGRLLAAGDALVASLGLTSARWQVLGAVAISPVPLPVAHIARNMGLTRQSVQRLVGEMSADGLVRFAPNPHHRRAKLVLLTERGQAAWQAAMSRQGPWVDQLAKRLRPESIRAGANLLRTLRDRLEAAATKGEEPQGRHRPRAKGVSHGVVRRNG